jgi:hypothetical protein
MALRVSPARPRRRRAPACAAAACLALLAAPALAEPADYVFVPYADPGAVIAAYAFGAEQPPEGGRERAQSLELGWAPTARWFTAAYAGWYAEPGEPTAFEGVSWLNQLLLTTPGAGPVDVGALCEIERPHQREGGTGLLCGALLQVDTDHLQFNFNPLFSRRLDAASPRPTDFSYQWQVKTLWRPGVELGAQGFGDLGPWNHWNAAPQQEHTLGPALFAKWPQGGGRTLSLDTAWLFGIGAGSPSDTFRLRIQQQF